MPLRKLLQPTLLERYPGDVHMKLHDVGDVLDIPTKLLEGEMGMDARGVTGPPDEGTTKAKRPRR